MRFALVMALPLALGAAAAGQAPGPVVFEPVEQAIGDISPLAISIRKVEPGLAQPTNFDQVFRYGDGYLRAQGGLYAVFDSSVYVRDRKHKGRLSPAVPPGTMYYIGAPPELPAIEPPPPSPDRVDGRVDLKISSRVTSGLIPGLIHGKAPQREPPAAAHASPAAEPGAIIADPEYRARRMRALMHDAARGQVATNTDQAAVGRSSSPSSK